MNFLNKYWKDPYWDDYYHIECDNGHKIVLPLTKIKKSKENFCYLCTGENRGNSRRNIYDYREICKEKGIYLGYNNHDDETPKKVRDKCWWKCTTCNYEFESCYNSIQQGKWCGKCFGKLNKTLDDYINVCKDTGEYLGIKDENNNYALNIPSKININSWWKCNKCKHEFETTFSSINQDFLCPKCAGRRIKKTLNDYREICKNKGIYLGYNNHENEIPKTVSDKCLWKCDKCEYVFESNYNRIQQDKWCPKCSGHLRKSLDDYREICKDKGIYLGFKDENNNYILDFPKKVMDNCWWKCTTCDYEFETCYNRIQQGGWCAKCSGNLRKTLDDYMNACKDKGKYLGLKTLSRLRYNKYILNTPEGTHSNKAFWKCDKCDYVWNASFDSINRGSWCPKCAGVLKKTLDDYINVCKGKGEYLGMLRCQGTRDENNNYILDIPKRTNIDSWWKCYSCNYEFETTFGSINQGTWCPPCAGKLIFTLEHYQNLGEELEENFIYLGLKDENNNYILDIPQKIQDNSWWKCLNCENIFEATFRTLKERGTRCAKCGDNIHFYSETNKQGFISEYEKIIIENNYKGKFLGIKVKDKIIYDIPLSFNNLAMWNCLECNDNFEKSYSNLKLNFCPLCSTCTTRTLEHYHHIIIKRGQKGKYLGIKDSEGNFLQDIPKSSDEKSWWECEFGHQFNTSYGQINSGTFCTFCTNKTENKLYDFLNKYFVVERQYSPNFIYNNLTKRYLKYDFYFEHKKYGKIIIECDGLQHFKQIMNWQDAKITQIIDIIKMIRALENDIRIIRISQTDVWENTIDYEKEIKKCIKNNNKINWIAKDLSIFDEHKLLLENYNTNEEILEKLKNIGVK